MNTTSIMSKKSLGLIYRHVLFYRLTMFLLYRTNYKKKYEAVAAEVEPGSTVVDLCCGECKIAPLLLKKSCKYIGLDINHRFVEYAQERGYDVRHFDVRTLDIPEGDVICIQSALYHFIPNDRALVEAMLKRARKKVIISEAVDNFNLADKSFSARFGRWVTRVNGESFYHRFTESSLLDLVSNIPGVTMKKMRVARELVVVLEKR